MSKKKNARRQKEIQTIEFSSYRAMWIFTIFDLPVKTKKQRKQYTIFRKRLLRKGFIMIQYSVYAHFCASEDMAKLLRKQVEVLIPPEGHVRLISITDKQFGKMEIYYGKKAKEPEQAPSQMLLF